MYPLPPELERHFLDNPLDRIRYQQGGYARPEEFQRELDGDFQQRRLDDLHRAEDEGLLRPNESSGSVRQSELQEALPEPGLSDPAPDTLETAGYTPPEVGGYSPQDTYGVGTFEATQPAWEGFDAGSLHNEADKLPTFVERNFIAIGLVVNVGLSLLLWAEIKLIRKMERKRGI